MTAALFILFAGLAIGCALAMVVQRNPLYSAISLIGVFISFACLYVMLAAPFIAAVQVIVYAGAIMVLVVFVILLLNVEEADKGPIRLRSLVPIAIVLAALFFAETAFIIYFVQASPATPAATVSDMGQTASIGGGLFTTYLLPFEITSILLLMAIVGAITLARTGGLLPTRAVVVPGQQVLAKSVDDLTPISSSSTDEVEQTFGIEGAPHAKEEQT